MTAPAWARGHDVQQLEELAALWADHDKGMIRGAFSRVSEATVAGWLDAGYVDQVGPPYAAVAWRHVRQREAVKDFTGQTVARMLPGDICVWRFAGEAYQVVDMLKALSVRATGEVYVHAWQEHMWDREVLSRLGAGWQGTKIRASSEMVGVYALSSEARPVGGADWPALARLELPALDVAPLAEELWRLNAIWADHYSSYNARNSWSAVALRGYGGLTAFIEKPAEMSKAWKREHPDELGWHLSDTALRSHFPEAEPLIDAIPGRKHRIRLMRLAPGGGELLRHADITDPDAGTADGRLMRIHVPLVTNDGVMFEGWQPDGSRQVAHMAAGAAWYLDTRKPHTAANHGETPRVHLVMDVESSPALRALYLGEPAAPAFGALL